MSWTTLSTITVTATKGEHHGVRGLFFYRDAGDGGGEVESYTDPYAEGLLGWGRQGKPRPPAAGNALVTESHGNTEEGQRFMGGGAGRRQLE